MEKKSKKSFSTPPVKLKKGQVAFFNGEGMSVTASSITIEDIAGKGNVKLNLTFQFEKYLKHSDGDTSDLPSGAVFMDTKEPLLLSDFQDAFFSFTGENVVLNIQVPIDATKVDHRSQLANGSQKKRKEK